MEYGMENSLNSANSVNFGFCECDLYFRKLKAPGGLLLKKDIIYLIKKYFNGVISEE